MPLLPLFVATQGPPVGPDSLGKAIAEWWAGEGLDTSVGTFYHIEIERIGNTRALQEAQYCVMQDAQPMTSVNVGKNKRAHDRIRRQFVVVGNDPLTISEACRNIFDAFNRLSENEFPMHPLAPQMIACRPTGVREVPVLKNRLPLPAGKSLLNGTVEVQFTLTRGEAP